MVPRKNLKIEMNRKTIITTTFALVWVAGVAQSTFDAERGCLNDVDISCARGLGEYGDNCVSANYTHERFISEQFSIGGGIGYSRYKDYDFRCIFAEDFKRYENEEAIYNHGCGAADGRLRHWPDCSTSTSHRLPA
jgi:hypothetical protein